MKSRIIISIKKLDKPKWGLIYQLIKRSYDNSSIDSEAFDELKNRDIDAVLKISDKYLDKDVFSEYGNDLQHDTQINTIETTFAIIYNKQDTNRDFSNLVPFYFLHKEFSNKVTFGINLEKFNLNNQSDFTFPCRTFFEIYRNTQPINGQNAIYFINEKYFNKETNKSSNFKISAGYFRDSDDKRVSRFILPITKINQENFYPLFKDNNKENEKIEYFKKSIEKLDKRLNTDILNKYCGYIFEEWFIKAYFISQNNKEIDYNSLSETITLLKSYYDNIKELVENIIFHTVEKEGLIYVIFNERKNLSEKQQEKLNDFSNDQSTDRFAEIGIIDFNEKGIVDTYKKNIVEEANSINLLYFFTAENIESTGLIPTHSESKNIAHVGIKMFAKSIKKYNGYFYVESNTDKSKASIEYSKTELTAETPLKYFFDGTHYEIVFPVSKQNIANNKRHDFFNKVTIDNFYDKTIKSISLAKIDNISQLEIIVLKKDYNKKIETIVKQILEQIDDNITSMALNMRDVKISHISLLKILLRLQQESENKLNGSEVILLTHLDNELIDKCCNVVYDLLLDKDTIWSNKHAIVLLNETIRCQIFCGKTKDEFLYVNEQICQKYNCTNYFKETYDKNVINEDDKKFFNTLISHPYECLTDKDTVFEPYVSKILDEPIEIDGYGCKVSNEITRLSSRMAINTFYEADFLFKDSSFADRFAQMIFNDLKNKPSYVGNKNDIVIIGYCYYSELLIKKLQFFVEKDFGKQPKVIIANESFDESKEEKLDFIHIPDEVIEEPEKYFYIVITPISTTLTTIDKIIALFKNKINNNNLSPINFINYCAILIRDGENDLTPKEINQGWKKKYDISEKKISTEFANAKEVNFILQKQGTWIGNFDKELFPKDWLNEEPINNTKNASLNSKNLMGYPSAYFTNMEDVIMEQRLDEVKDFIYCGHLIQSEKYHQRYCFYTEGFIKKNIAKQETGEAVFLKWLHSLRDENKFKNLEQKTNILITPYSDVETDFVNVINKELFDNKAQILYIEVDKPRGNINFKYSFLRKHKHENYEEVAFHFVDNVLSTGESFKRAKSYLLSILDEYDPDTIKFESIITFVNRLSKNRIQEIKKYDSRDKSDIIYSFINLFIPPAKEFSKECTLCELKHLYEDMKKNTVLNSCRKTIDTKLKKIQEKSFDSVKNKKDKKPLPPIEDRNFAKLKLTHRIYYEISKIVNDTQITNADEIKKLDDKIRINLDSIYDDCVAKDNIEESDDKKIEKLSFLKAISAPPLNQYVKIRYYAHRRLLNALNDLIDTEKNKNPSYYNIQELKVILKQLSCLKANALVRRDVIVQSWTLYYIFKELHNREIKQEKQKLQILKTKLSRYTKKTEFEKNEISKINNLFYRDILKDDFEDDLNKILKEKFTPSGLYYDTYIFLQQINTFKEEAKPLISKIKKLEANKHEDFNSEFQFFIKSAIYNDEAKSMWLGELLRAGEETWLDLLGTDEELKISKTTPDNNLFKALKDKGYKDREYQIFLVWLFYDNTTITRKTLKDFEKELDKDKKIKLFFDILNKSGESQFNLIKANKKLVANILNEDEESIIIFEKEWKDIGDKEKNEIKEFISKYEKYLKEEYPKKVNQYYYFAFKKYINQTDKGPTGNPDKIAFIEKLIYVLEAKRMLDEMLKNIKKNKNELEFDKFISILLDIFKNIMGAKDAFFSMAEYEREGDNSKEEKIKKIHTIAKSQNFTKEINYETSFVKHIFEWEIDKIINPLQISNALRDEKRNDYFEKAELNYQKMICLSLFKQREEDIDDNETKTENKTLKINGIFSFLYDNLNDNLNEFNILSKEYGRLLLLLKPELDEYIEHILSEKIFDLWVEKNESDRKFNKIYLDSNHTFGKYEIIDEIDFDKLDSENLDKVNISYLSHTNMLISHIYSSISNKAITCSIPSHSDGLRISDILDAKFISLLHSYEKTRWQGNFSINCNFDTGAKTTFNKQLLRAFIIQCLDNARHKHIIDLEGKITLVINNEQIIIISDCPQNSDNDTLTGNKKEFDKKKSHIKSLICRDYSCMTLTSLEVYCENYGYDREYYYDENYNFIVKIGLI